MLRVGPDPSQAAAYAEAEAALQAFRRANPSVGGLAVLGTGMRPSASTQFVGADDPRHVLFDGTVIVSASALAGAALLASMGSGIAVVPHGGIGSHMAQHGAAQPCNCRDAALMPWDLADRVASHLCNKRGFVGGRLTGNQYMPPSKTIVKQLLCYR